MKGPGLLDLQVNGYAGVDFNDPALTADALDHALHAMLQAGVTQCLPTLITATADQLAARFAALDAAVAHSRLGPLMAPLRRPIRLLTLAAELPGAEALIAWAAAHGIVVAIGHSDAGAAVVARAAAAGARMSTHLGNGLPQVLPKLDNPIMAQLAEDRLVAGFIADGVHLPVAALRVMVRAKGPGRAVLVTDAVAAAAAPPGRYGFAGMAIDGAADGSVRTPGAGTLAGSALTLDRAVRNVVGWGIADAAGAVAMASTAPAALMGLPPTGDVEWTADLHVQASRVGDVVYRRPA